ncbi:MAG: hypothetical protein M3069_04190, partial [Chloroflexota bacterium]|nr:hypothetical protein [Chloroflexota bacterium]
MHVVARLGHSHPRPIAGVEPRARACSHRDQDFTFAVPAGDDASRAPDERDCLPQQVVEETPGIGLSRKTAGLPKQGFAAAMQDSHAL